MSRPITFPKRPVVGVAALGALALAGLFAVAAIQPSASAATTKSVTLLANNEPRSMTFYDGSSPRCLTGSANFIEAEGTLIDSNTFSSTDCSGARLTHCLTTVPANGADSLTLVADTCTWS